MTEHDILPADEFDYIGSIQVNAQSDYNKRFGSRGLDPAAIGLAEMRTPIGLLACGVCRTASVKNGKTTLYWSTRFTLDGERKAIHELEQMGLVVASTGNLASRWLRERAKVHSIGLKGNMLTTKMMYGDFFEWAVENKMRSIDIPPMNTFSQLLKSAGVSLKRQSYGTIAPHVELLTPRSRR